MLNLIVEKVFESKILSFILESQINRIVWKQQIENKDLEALKRLMDAIENGKIGYQKEASNLGDHN